MTETNPLPFDLVRFAVELANPQADGWGGQQRDGNVLYTTAVFLGVYLPISYTY